MTNVAAYQVMTRRPRNSKPEIVIAGPGFADPARLERRGRAITYPNLWLIEALDTVKRVLAEGGAA